MYHNLTQEDLSLICPSGRSPTWLENTDQIKREATEIAPRSVVTSFSVGGSMNLDMPGAGRQVVREFTDKFVNVKIKYLLRVNI